jgi:hypothetical protein
LRCWRAACRASPHRRRLPGLAVGCGCACELLACVASLLCSRTSLAQAIHRTTTTPPAPAMPADAAPAAAAAPDAAPGSAASADELAAAPEAVQMTDEEELSAAGGGDNSDSSKLKTLMGILKRMVGVKDIAAM